MRTFTASSFFLFKTLLFSFRKKVYFAPSFDIQDANTLFIISKSRVSKVLCSESFLGVGNQQLGCPTDDDGRTDAESLGGKRNHGASRYHDRSG